MEEKREAPKEEKKPVQSKAKPPKRKVKAKRYFDNDEEAPQALETFSHEGDGVFVDKWRLRKWKKRRLQTAEDASEADSKSTKPQKKTADRPPYKVADQKKEMKKKKPKKSPLDDLEQPGYIEYGSDEEVGRVTQTEIVEAVDVTSATKYFELGLNDFGPYSIDYSRNGRHLALGGKQGHLAAFDWQTKRLSFEINTNDINCVKWLHQETMLAAAHPTGVCVYDNLGLELHALTDLEVVVRMEFLPHHMLLATSNEKGFLGYTDVSIGTRAGGICTGLGRLDVMTQNPANAIIHLGHASGTVTLWSPSVSKPLVKVLTHKAPVRSIAIDSTGNYMATSSVDKRLKVFDLRTYRMVNSTHLPMGAGALHFSQRGLLAAAMGNRTQVYRDCRSGALTPYLSHVTNCSQHAVQFCPYEDVLGVGHHRGFSSLLVPGAGDVNYNALGVNPMANTKQRQNAEVRQLLDKLQPEMIGLKNWVWELANKKGGEQKSTQHSGRKLGKKQKEEQHRQRKREAQRMKNKSADAAADPSNPLARFQKPSV